MPGLGTEDVLHFFQIFYTSAYFLVAVALAIEIQRMLHEMITSCLKHMHAEGDTTLTQDVLQRLVLARGW